MPNHLKGVRRIVNDINKVNDFINPLLLIILVYEKASNFDQLGRRSKYWSWDSTFAIKENEKQT